MTGKQTGTCWICEDTFHNEDQFGYVGIFICGSCKDILETIDEFRLKEIIANEERSSSANRMVTANPDH